MGRPSKYPPEQWFPGVHQPLVTPDEYAAAQRVQIAGRNRRGKDLLSGRVRCGLCSRIIGIKYNGKGTAIYRCKHRGQRCDSPGRSAPASNAPPGWHSGC